MTKYIKHVIKICKTFGNIYNTSSHKTISNSVNENISLVILFFTSSLKDFHIKQAVRIQTWIYYENWIPDWTFNPIKVACAKKENSHAGLLQRCVALCRCTLSLSLAPPRATYRLLRWNDMRLLIVCRLSMSLCRSMGEMLFGLQGILGMQYRCQPLGQIASKAVHAISTSLNPSISQTRRHHRVALWDL